MENILQVLSNLLEQHGQGLCISFRSAGQQGAKPGNAGVKHHYRQVCFMLASTAIAEVMKAASKWFSCQKGGEWDLQWEVKLNLLVIKGQERCVGSNWCQWGLSAAPLSKLQSRWNIGFSVHQIAVIKSGADGSMSHHNFLISRGQVFKIFLDSFLQRFLPASDL